DRRSYHQQRGRAARRRGRTNPSGVARTRDAAGMSEIIPVALGDHSYDIHVGPGLLDQAGILLKPMARGPVPVVPAEILADLHLDRLVDTLRAAQIDARPIIVEPGEGAKSFASLERLVRTLLITGVARDGLIVALGGGVVGDLTGFAAGILKRG